MYNVYSLSEKKYYFKILNYIYYTHVRHDYFTTLIKLRFQFPALKTTSKIPLKASNSPKLTSKCKLPSFVRKIL